MFLNAFWMSIDIYYMMCIYIAYFLLYITT